MKEKNLIIHLPVLHRGYLELLEANKQRINSVYLVDEKLLEELTEFKPDIASIDIKTARELLSSLGYKNIAILTPDNIKEIKGKELLLVADEVSRNLSAKYLSGGKIEWVSVFLRWDKEAVLTEKVPDNIARSQDSFDLEIIKEAFKESKKSSDWWRQIGAVLVKDGQIIIRANNKDLPSDHTPYQVGEVRDFFQTGEKHELASTIHAEQKIIAEAAKRGISLEGTALYATTFSCPVCAKLIACSGIKAFYFAEGGSNFDAQKVLESAEVKIVYLPQKTQ